jgi:hypothetical protein
MKYYLKLNSIPNWQYIQSNALEYLKNNTVIYERKKGLSFCEVSDFYNDNRKLINDCFRKINLNVISTAFYVTYNNDQGSLHSDNSKFQARINIPILNCENSYTEYYTVSKTRFYTNDRYTIKLPEHDAIIELVDRVELTCPTIIRVNEFHKITIGNQTPRISLTIGFDHDPIYLLT